MDGGALTAVETSGPRRVVGAVGNGAADAGAVAPDQLGEVAPRILVVRVVVRVLELFLVPSVDDGARKLKPLLVGAGGR